MTWRSVSYSSNVIEIDSDAAATEIRQTIKQSQLYTYDGKLDKPLYTQLINCTNHKLSQLYIYIYTRIHIIICIFICKITHYRIMSCKKDVKLTVGYWGATCVWSF